MSNEQDHDSQVDIKTIKTTTTTVIRMEWLMDKIAFDSITEIGQKLSSQQYDVMLGTEKVKFVINLFPKGKKADKEGFVSVYIVTMDSLNNSMNRILNVKFGIKTSSGLLKLIKKRSYLNCSKLQQGHGFSKFLPKIAFLQCFRKNKIAIVADLTVSVDDSSYVEDMKKAHDFKSLSDLIITCGRRKFPCHKIILASRSSVFKAMLETDMVEKNTSEVKIEDSSPKTVQMMLEYIYMDDIPKQINDVLIATDLIHLSVKYDLPSLTNACEASLLSSLDTDNALAVLVTLDTYRPQCTSRQEVLDYIVLNAVVIVDSDHWLTYATDKKYAPLMREVVRSIAVKNEDDETYDVENDDDDEEEDELYDNVDDVDDDEVGALIDHYWENYI